MGMYDKLGDMLNDFLTSGRMPPPRNKATPPDESGAETSGARQHSGESGTPVPDRLIPDFYRLGFGDLRTTPSFAECKKAYRALVKAHHPDTSTHETPQQKRLAEIAESFKRISLWYETEKKR
jgi:hypothetical protein